MKNAKRKSGRSRVPRVSREGQGDIRASGGAASLCRLLEQAATAALAAERVKVARLDIAVIDAAEMKRQHKQWMGDGSVTDVLTFDLRDRPRGAIEGQILVCQAVAKMRAGPRGDWRRELALYVVHGCLHLCGYDDHAARDFAKMHAREDEILATLGMGRVFAEGPASHPKAKSPREH